MWQFLLGIIVGMALMYLLMKSKVGNTYEIVVSKLKFKRNKGNIDNDITPQLNVVEAKKKPKLSWRERRKLKKKTKI